MSEIGDKEKEYRELDSEERRIIIDKGTELPFMGKYFEFFKDGIYTCKRCGAMLYSSETKFKCGCGWPSFDDDITGAVRKTVDSDGVRTEIVCANCGAHLGHVFTGEHLTPKNTRHCVNSVSLLFVPEKEVNYKRAYFAAGCFWGVEQCMAEIDGVISTSAGYMGGTFLDPTYADVCTGKTGHAETVFVCYDPVRVTFETLAKHFFEIHDPTRTDRQGPDVGSQYRSAIFYTKDEDEKTALKLKKRLEDKGLNIATAIEAAEHFWKAEDYHQNYFKSKKINHGCSVPVFRWNEP